VHVDFWLGERGVVHVIEEERRFARDWPSSVMRKLLRLGVATPDAPADSISWARKAYAPFDWTVQLYEK
jgi:hypothetical protein